MYNSHIQAKIQLNQRILWLCERCTYMVVVRARSNPIDMIVFVIRMQSQLNEHRNKKKITETEESVKDTINSCFNKFSFVHDS